MASNQYFHELAIIVLLSVIADFILAKLGHCTLLVDGTEITL